MYYGDFIEDATVDMVWSTHDSTGLPITQSDLVAGDVIIFKDGSATQKTSTNGITVTTDFDSRTGLHLISLDTSNDTGDAGFWVAQADYQVAIDAVTVNGIIVRFWVGIFSIENRSADVRRVGGAAQTAGDLAAMITTLDTVADGIKAVTDLIPNAGALSDIATILVDTNELQTDWVNGGRLDAILDLVATTADLLDKLGAVDEAAAAGDPSSTESVMQYVKQLVNALLGTTGIVTYPAEAAPANGVSIAEVLRAVHADVTGLAGAAMRGTDSASLASVATEARLAELDAANLPVDIDAILVDTGTTIPALLPAALVGGRMNSDVGAKTGNVALSAQEKLDVNAEVDGAFTTQIADSIPADGVIATREQGIYMILQVLTEFAISGTTLTVKKVDGSTTLMTLTLGDDTNPTSLTRAT